MIEWTKDRIARMIQAVDLKVGQLSSTGDIELRDKYQRDKRELERMQDDSDRMEKTQVGKWQCPRCQLLNSMADVWCESCGTYRAGA